MNMEQHILLMVFAATVASPRKKQVLTPRKSKRYMKKIKSIEFPNTVRGDETNSYSAPRFFFKEVWENGEMATVRWYEVWEGGEGEGEFRTLIAKIKESICNIYY